MLQLQHETKAGRVECRFYGAEHPGFGANQTDTYQKILDDIAGASAICFVEQVHGDQVLRVIETGKGVASLGQGDALLTNLPAVALVVRTADCIPILIHCRETGLIAAVHAGWRGLAANILTKTVKELCTNEKIFAHSLYLDVGPFIEAGSYEVGPEVASQFEGHCSVQRPNGKFSLDLSLALNDELASLAILPSQVQWHRSDTFVSPEWYSARRGDTLRNFAVITRSIGSQ